MVESVAVDAYVLDVLMRDLIAHDKHPSAFLVYLHVWRRCHDARAAVHLSPQMIADATGLSKSAVQTAVAALEQRKLVKIERASPTATPGYTLVRHWRR